MEEQVIRKLIELDQRVEGMAIPEKPIDLISPFLALPGLVGFWPMSSVQRSTGNAYDISGQSRTLTYAGNPTYNIYNNLVPYIDLDGTGDWLTRADETDLDILGTETIYNSSVWGLTIVGWFWTDDNSASQYFASKDIAAGNLRSWQLVYITGNEVQFIVSTDGAATVTVSGIDIDNSTWYFTAARFTPSTELKLWQNSTTSTQTVGVPASLFNTSADFRIGARGNGASPLDGRASLYALCANAIPDAIISALFQQTRVAFGV